MPKLLCDRAEERPEKRLRRQLPQGTAIAGYLGGVVAFNDARAWLRSSGWYFKPPSRRSLDPGYRYIRPGGYPDGHEGVDFLLGEDDALQYAAAATAVIKGTSESRAALFAPEKLVAIAAKDVSKVSVALRVCAVLGEVEGEGAVRPVAGTRPG
ncbi:hypothetical protein PI124_g22779 [Phytophthora idaei]|nr:hypothetical protein PI125_g24556 [Phytophthora idaei]KAG3125293.1 hypothetical protein PI126_g22834 [Phytophthora idaei]KAG3232133.1 hypothetical protein PI124_g22779 [Phytophthora idaei]